MKIAIDKDTINQVKDFSKNEYVYIFNDDEKLEDLIKLNLHCINVNYTETLKDFKYAFKKDYKFAIIVPNYNNDHGQYKGKTYLQNCIESILNQTYKNFELIIVDDMSTDSSVETVEKYRKNEEYIDKIHLLTNKRKRYNGGSRNVGIEYALDYLDFDYFCFLDSDDWWKDENVLKEINDQLYNHELMLIGLECIDKNGVFITKFHEYNNYEDFFLSDNKVWCTAWARVIRKDKIVYFCEDTLMEDRVWSYKQADNVNFNKVKNFKRICYVWNRLNTSNSVSLTRGDYWNASAWCHIGHQKQLLAQLKHKEMKPIIEQRIKECMNKINIGIYQQY